MTFSTVNSLYYYRICTHLHIERQGTLLNEFADHFSLVLVEATVVRLQDALKLVVSLINGQWRDLIATKVNIQYTNKMDNLGAPSPTVR